MLLWVLGANVEQDWAICGIFSTREGAVEHCTTEDHYIFPLMLDDWLGDEHTPAPAIYPLLERNAKE